MMQEIDAINNVLRRTIRFYGVQDFDLYDIVQETWMKALASCESTGQKWQDQSMGWWATVAKTVTLDYLKAKHRQKRDERKTESLTGYLEDVDNAGDGFFDNPLIDYGADPLEIIMKEENE